MRRLTLFTGLVMAGIIALWGLLQSSVTLQDIFTHPWSSIWGSRRQLNLELLEISERMEPASRRLLKPFGEVRLIRALPTKGPQPEQPTRSDTSASGRP